MYISVYICIKRMYTCVKYVYLYICFLHIYEMFKDRKQSNKNDNLLRNSFEVCVSSKYICIIG